MAPFTIGRYRVVRLLGRGGMGEVYEGYDDQLRRPVAIKGLVHDRMSPERRERLRREALSIAALSHPAITHIYEIVAEDDADWVVMEYVDGSPLADVIVPHPLPPAEAARIGAEIAEALAEAHRRGIVHRDIKTENVMVTPSGHVKVLDFGLAKWTGARGAGDDRITTEGLVVGTSKAMSPEQALGRDVDARSDLFSLGSTLYELVTGKAAFHGATPLETMHKVAGVECERIRAAAPHVPEPLAVVIERCMAARPADRYQTADEVAAELRRVATSLTGATAAQTALRSSQVLASARRHWAVGAVIAGALTVAAVVALQLGWLAPRKPLTVAVLPVTVEAPEGSARLASAAVADAIASRLAELRDVTVLAGREVRGVRTEGRRASEIALELGVERLVETSFVQPSPADPARISLAVTRSDGTVAWSEQLDVGTDNLLLLQDRITTAIQDVFRGYSWTAASEHGKLSEPALRRFLEVNDRIGRGAYSRGLVEEKALLQHVVDEAPGYTPGQVSLGNACVYRFTITRDPAELECARACLARAQALAPGDPRVRGLEVEVLIQDGRKDEALDTARKWASARPGDFRAWQAVAVASRRLRRLPEAEQAFRRSIALLPRWQSYSQLASAYQEHGDFARAREAAREALRRVPGNVEATSALAEVEMYAGDNAAAERLYRDLMARRGSPVDRLHLGNCLFYQNRFAEAAEAYRDAVRHTPGDYIAVANLADTEVVMDRRADALGHYAAALALTDAPHASGERTRPLLETRARCLARLGRGPEAVAVIQDALAAFPDNPATLYMAALVSAVLGERSSAISWTAKARAQNAPAVWFSTPEFADLATDSAFQALLR